MKNTPVNSLVIIPYSIYPHHHHHYHYHLINHYQLAYILPLYHLLLLNFLHLRDHHLVVVIDILVLLTLRLLLPSGQFLIIILLE